MANNINLIEKYLPQAVDKVFAMESRSKILDNGAKFMDLNFKEAGYVKIASILMDGLSDYHRVNSGDGTTTGTHYHSSNKRDGYEKGNAELTWELFQLRFDRGKQFQIDAMDDEETAGLMIGNLLSEFIRTKVVPEVDALTFGTLAGKCSVSLGNLKTEDTIEDNTIIKDLNDAFVWLADHEVPDEDQVIFVNPTVWGQMLNTTEIEKRISQSEFKDNVSFEIARYMGREIIVVPSSRFFTDVKLDNGFYPQSSSKLINYMVVSKKAVIPVKKLEYNKIWTPDQVQDFNGYKVNFRMYHDVIVPKNKLAGVYCSVSTTAGTTKANKLDLDIDVSGGAGHNVIKAYYTTPAGLMGKLVMKGSAMPVGSTASGTTDVFVGVDFTKAGGSNYFALIDENKKVIAASGNISTLA